MRQGDRDRVGEGGGGLVGRVGKGNRQPVYYQGSIEKHLGTNRTPPPCHPKPFSPCQPGPFSQTPWGSGRGVDGGEEAGSGWWWWGSAEDGVPRYHPSMMLQMLYPSNGTRGVTSSHMAPFSFTPEPLEHTPTCTHTCRGPAVLLSGAKTGSHVQQLAQIMPPTHLLQPGHSSNPTGSKLNYHQQTEGSLSLYT